MSPAVTFLICAAAGFAAKAIAAVLAHKVRRRLREFVFFMRIPPRSNWLRHWLCPRTGRSPADRQAKLTPQVLLARKLLIVTGAERNMESNFRTSGRYSVSFRSDRALPVASDDAVLSNMHQVGELSAFIAAA